jgi:hypothetical protein
LSKEPNQSIKKLLKNEKRRLDWNLELLRNRKKQTHFVHENVEKRKSYFAKHFRLFWSIKCFELHIFNQFNFRSLEHWYASLYLAQIWMVFHEVGAEKENIPIYFLLSNYILTFDFIVTRLFFDLVKDLFFWLVERRYLVSADKKHARPTLEKIKIVGQIFQFQRLNAETSSLADIYYFIYLGIFDTVLLLSFGSNPKILMNAFLLIILNSELNMQFVLIFGSLGCSISLILNAFPAEERFILGSIPLIFAAISFSLLFLSRRILTVWMLFITVLSLMISAISSMENFRSANSDANRNLKNYFQLYLT